MFVLRNNGVLSDPFENGDANCLVVHTVSPGLIALPVSALFCAFSIVHIVSMQKDSCSSLLISFSGSPYIMSVVENNEPKK